MVKKDPRIDAYIARQRDFARPILARLRALVHTTCPEVTETLKWRSPSFEYHGILCGMAAFQEHAVFGFWKHELVVGDDRKAQEAMGSFGRLRSLDDLPTKAEFARLMKKAMQLNEMGIKAVRQKTTKKPIPMHPEFKKALAANRKAKTTFDAFPPSAQRDYLEWIADAKAAATRSRRIETSVEWLAEGKRRNWKYEKC
ncbi:MAG: hypothetical protein EYC70_03355 [Planctomycetota bacterium]|nr:MAG: hypothetical protein EYC70_03355 [Planctomycetota bacterium]